MISFIKKMWWFISKNKRYYIIAFVFATFQALSLLLPAVIIENFTSAIEDSNLTWNYLLNNIILEMVFVSILIYVFSTTRRFLNVLIKVRIFYALQVRFMENILKQDALFFEKFQSGDLLARALGDVKSVHFSGGNRLVFMYYQAVLIICYVVAMAIINPLLTLYCMIPLALMFVINMVLRVKVMNNWKKVRVASSNMSNVVLESITNVYTVRAFSKEEENYKKNLEFSKKTYDVEKKNLFVISAFQPIYQSIIAISLVIAYFFAAKKIPGSSVFTLALFAQFVIYLNSLASPLTNIGNVLSKFYQSIISSDRLGEIYDSNSVIVDKEDAITLDHIDNISFKNISFKYPNDDDVILNCINLDIKKGQTIGIVGKTGSGKSTLIRQLLRQFPIGKGELLINGINVNDYTKESVRKMISYVPQEHTLFTRTVIQNVEFGRGDDSEDFDYAYKMIKAADFEKDIENLPNGLKTVVGEYGVTLSGGQKQRLSIARAFMKDSDLMILDDSLSAVDGKTESNIINNLNTVRKGKTNIIIAHRLSAVMNADKIIVLDNGKISEEGTHEELMENKGWYYELFNHQLMSKDGD